MWAYIIRPNLCTITLLFALFWKIRILSCFVDGAKSSTEEQDGIFFSLSLSKMAKILRDLSKHRFYIDCIFHVIQSKSLKSSENESPESEEVVKAAPVQRATKSQTANQRKRSKPVVASKKRTRPLRP